VILRSGVKRNLHEVKNLAIRAPLLSGIVWLPRKVVGNSEESAMFGYDRSFLVVTVALVTALVLSPIGPVRAATLVPQASSVTVRFHSGDLDTPRGVAGLYRRIRTAAKAVCGQPDDALLLDNLLWNDCVDQAIAGAVANVHSNSLSAYRRHQIRGRKLPLQEAPEHLAARAPIAP
jgi:UrcA family protein